MGRPSPLYRAKRLEKALKTPAKIYYKREDVSPTGSHKLNTAIAQAYYIAKEGFENVTTETGAGQWGSALALATNFFGLNCKVFMVRCSYERSPHRKYVMNLYNANVVASPSSETEVGRELQKDEKYHAGSLGIAISEAIEVATQDENTVYSLGSVLNHVLTHQSIIGQEAIKQFELIEEYPDTVIGCVGGGSNFAGLAYPFLEKNFSKKKETEFIGVEPSEVPTLTKGDFKYDYGDISGLTPSFEMYTLGHKFIPEAIYAGGLRYHGAAPSLSFLAHEGFIKAESYSQEDCFNAAKLFAETEGLIVAPETSHAVKSAIEHALIAKKNNEEKTILFNLSGHGLLDLQGYANVLRL